MAQYQTPPDPRESELRPRRKRHQRSDRRDWIPWIGLFFGLLVTVVAIFIAWQLVQRALDIQPLDAEPIPTVIVLTAPASPTPTTTPGLTTPTPIATLTPQPATDNSQAPENVTVDYYAAVTNTGGIGVTVRGGPSTDNVRLLVATEGTTALVVAGPSEGSGFTWWQVRLDDGTEGWIASDFLTPADKPETEQ